MSRLKEQLFFAHQVDIYYYKNQFHINSQDHVYMVTKACLVQRGELCHQVRFLSSFSTFVEGRVASVYHFTLSPDALYERLQYWVCLFILYRVYMMTNITSNTVAQNT